MHARDDAPGEDFELRTERWCAGLRFVGSRPLEPAERAALVERSDQLRRLLRLAVAGALALLVWPVALVALRGHAVPELARVALSVAAAFGWLFGIPLVTFAAVDLGRIRRRHLADLDGGEAWLFEGLLAPGEESDPRQRALFAAGVLRPEPRAAQRLAVLPRSRTVLAGDVRGRRRFHPVTLHEVAEAPRYALRVPLPRGIAWSEDPGVEFLKRTLNESERAELGHHVRRLLLPGRAAALGLLLLAVVVAAFAWAVRAEGLRPLLRKEPLVPLWLLAGALGLYGYARGVQLALRLRRDLGTGWVITYHRREQGEIPLPDPREGTEFLPHSLAVWNVGGKPARWRDLGRAA